MAGELTKIERITWPGNLPSVHDAEYPRLNAHHTAWGTAVSRGLRQRCYLIQATDDRDTVGVLPLCLVAGPIFGKFLVSLPYVNTGGVWARDENVAQQLVTEACQLADELDVKYLELRHEVGVPHERLNFERTDKFHMRLELPDSHEALKASFKSKLRSQIKKSTEYGLTVQFGHLELLSEFYAVFATRMRDLGTPVFSKQLFQEILGCFGDDAEICLVKSDAQTAAAAILVHAHGLTEVPSASCHTQFNRMNANMFMYWNLLTRAIDRGSHTFDFGRSSEGSGTYKFKAQWKSRPCPAVWQYYVRKGDPNDMRPDSGNKQKLIEIWKRLPVWFTKLVGPQIVRGIP